ncbi:ABC transporter permease [Paenibacillus silvisoli]|uniref:ABC transporter permease n=1 Tax=Paenibacillus silvisoli TaxID=3110539 RepID=UPI002805078D|nr:ABC transporter permease subunit [Paenibacillus silvisoli]
MPIPSARAEAGMSAETRTDAHPAANVKAKRSTRRPVPKRTLVSLYVLLAPTLILLFIFNYVPMYGILIAFQDFSVYRGALHSPWAGFKHFGYFLTDDTFWHVMRNTFLLNLYDLLFGFTAPVLFALLANEIRRPGFKRTMQTISYLPHFLSWIVVSGIIYRLLSPENGLVNGILESVFGMGPIDFMTSEAYFRTIAVAADIWKSVGWSAILYFATIAGIDSTLYEAAMIDGANRFRQTIHVTLPALVPLLVLLLLLRLSSMFGIDFERVFLLQNPLVYDVSDVISTYVYRMGLEKAQYSLTTAIGLLQGLLGFGLLLGANRLAKRWAGMGLY